MHREVVRQILCRENKFRQPSSSQKREFLKSAEQPAAQTQPIVVTESPPAKRDVQTPVLEQKQMSTPSRLPAAKKTRTRVVKPPSRFKDFVA